MDASDPAPLGHHRREVRSILSDRSNVGEGIKKEKHAYTETVSSLVSRRSSVTASVSDLVGKVLTLSAEAEYMREHSKEMEINGNNTENDSFKTNCYNVMMCLQIISVSKIHD